MSERFLTLQPVLSKSLTGLTKVVFGTVLLLNVWANPLLADPFRTSEPRNIGDNTEAAFNAIFQQGDYQAAERFIEKALATEPDEPLAYAMKASLAYTNKDLATLETYSQKTLETAQKLVNSDPLRGNLYVAVGNFLQGAVILSREGTINGAPQALRRLREVYLHLDKAAAVSANDPELNLVKGYMDLMLAVNLPFANPEQAIQRLEKNAGPQYLVDRGIAIAYRDLKQYPRALEYTDRALKSTSDNPELHYLRGQILREQGKKDKNPQIINEALTHFDKALSKKTQLPEALVKQIERERRNAAKSVENAGR